MKKILTWILSIAMVLTMMPVMGAQAKDPVRVIKLDKVIEIGRASCRERV